MNHLNQYIQNKINSNTKFFVPYITAGDPDLLSTKKYMYALIQGGADIIELGVPFSDPVADGVTNQQAAERALKNGISISNVMDLVKEIRNEGVSQPIILFTYYNPIFSMGLDLFFQRAQECGVSGVLVVDLPPEEACEYSNKINQTSLGAVFLASPTTSAERLKKISDLSTGFVYYISRTGVTGVQNELSDTLEAELKQVRQWIDKPIAVGFGISTAEQAYEVSRIADGVVVGSALVKIIAENGASEFGFEKIKHLVQQMTQKMNEINK